MTVVKEAQLLRNLVAVRGRARQQRLDLAVDGVALSLLVRGHPRVDRCSDRRHEPDPCRNRCLPLLRHQGAEMRPKPVQLRYRPASRWPANTSLDPSTGGTAKAGKPYRHLAEERRHRMVAVVLHTANIATACAARPPNGVLPGLRSHDLPLNTCEQQLRFGQGQTQIGDIDEITGPVDLHDVHARTLAPSPDFYQPQQPSHASTLGQRTNAKIPNWPPHPQSCDGPADQRRNPLLTHRSMVPE